VKLTSESYFQSLLSRLELPLIEYNVTSRLLYTYNRGRFSHFRSLTSKINLFCRIYSTSLVEEHLPKKNLFYNTLFRKQRNEHQSSSFRPILSSDVERSCLKPDHSVIIESRQTKCPIWRVVQGTES